MNNSNNQQKSFKEKYSLQERREDAKRRMKENPGHVPIVLTMDRRSKLPPIDNGKFLMPEDYNLSEFQHIVRQKMQLSKETAIMFFVNNKNIPKLDSTMLEVYEQHKDEDSILYITVADVAAFG